MTKNLLVWENMLKNTQPFQFQYKKNLQKLIKKGEEITKTTSYRLQFIDSVKFMASLLSSLVNNDAKRIHKIKCNTNTMIKNVKLAELNTQILKMI